MDIAVIPAYNPNQKLVELVLELHEKGLHNIVVVNDGSEENTDSIFKELTRYSTVLTHQFNKGKGSAIKTALNYIAKQLNNNIEGIVILDADGQHRPEDALRLLEVVHNCNFSLVLGVRSFDGKIPFRSLFGNIVTRYVFRICSGKWVSDTQTGLRAFSMDMIPKLLAVSGDRYEYEMNVLLTCTKSNTMMKEVPIATVYHDESNSSSHFRTIRDSLRIYGNLLAFSGASFISFLLDYLLFILLVRLFGFGFSEATALILGNVGARVISAGFNYHLNSIYVFRCSGNKVRSIFKYALLACFILILNTVILYCLHDYLGLNNALAKILTEMTLFIISFIIQNFFIFNKDLKEEVVKL